MSNEAHSLQIRTPAETDIQQALEFWLSERKELAVEFLEELDVLLQRVQSYPFQFQIRYKDFRVAFMQRFPYAVHFTCEADKIIVHAILHTSRDLGSRLREVDDPWSIAA